MTPSIPALCEREYRRDRLYDREWCESHHRSPTRRETGGGVPVVSHPRYSGVRHRQAQDVVDTCIVASNPVCCAVYCASLPLSLALSRFLGGLYMYGRCVFHALLRVSSPVLSQRFVSAKCERTSAYIRTLYLVPVYRASPRCAKARYPVSFCSIFLLYLVELLYLVVSDSPRRPLS